jgi:hypothetical protein
MTYRVLHAHCYQDADDSSAVDRIAEVRGHEMYGCGVKSKTLLAHVVHLLTLGAYAWDDSCSDNSVSTAHLRNLGGGNIGSVFHDRDRESALNACDWIFMASLLREPLDVMDCQWYHSKENTLTLLTKIGCEGGNAFLSGLDPALQSEAAWLSDFAAKINPIAAAGATGIGIGSSKEGLSKEEEQERKKMAAKAKAMAHVQKQMRKFAATIVKSPGFEDDDRMSDDVDCSRSLPRDVNETSIYSTPVLNRSGLESEDMQVMDLSPGNFIYTSPIASPITPFTLRTPHTPYMSCYSTPRTSHHTALNL